MLTTYFGYEGCSKDQKSQINQAQKDAVMLAANAVKSPGIDFGNSAAVCTFLGGPFQRVQRLEPQSMFQEQGDFWTG